MLGGSTGRRADVALANSAADSTTIADWAGNAAASPEQRLAQLTRMLVTCRGSISSTAPSWKACRWACTARFDGHVTFANDSFCKIMGCPPSEVRGRSVSEVAGAEHASQHLSEIAQVIVPARSFKARSVTRPPAALEASTSSNPGAQFSGEIIGVQGLMFDISAKRRSASPKRRRSRPTRPRTASWQMSVTKCGPRCMPSSLF